MKIVLTFMIIVAVTALLITSTPVQILSFFGACALLGGIVVRRKRQSHVE